MSENGREHIHPDLLSLIDEAERLDWLFVNKLKKDDVLEVQTRNTLYTMKILEPEHHTVIVTSNGKHITRSTSARVVGTTLTGTGTMVKIGGVAVGFRLLLEVDDGERGDLILSTTQEVKINGVKVLPREK